LSNSRRAKYWFVDDQKKGKIGVKLTAGIESGKYVFQPKGRNNKLTLFDVEKGIYVVRNPRSVGTPKIIPINSQIVWESGNTNVFSIRATKHFLAEWFGPGIVRQLPDKIFTGVGEFIHLEYIFYYPFDARKWPYQDYINHWYIRGKVFEDTLVAKGKIPDDSPQFIRGGYARYVNVPNEEDRKLEIKIHFCKNDERIS
jgi:hypothetical protein